MIAAGVTACFIMLSWKDIYSSRGGVMIMSGNDIGRPGEASTAAAGGEGNQGNEGKEGAQQPPPLRNPPNWPSKEPGMPSGPGRDNNPPK